MRILVVEDEPKVAAFIKQGLEDSGHEVTCAVDGLAGKRKAKDESLDLILLDLLLPRMNRIFKRAEPFALPTEKCRS